MVLRGMESGFVLGEVGGEVEDGLGLCEGEKLLFKVECEINGVVRWVEIEVMGGGDVGKRVRGES